MSRTRSDGSAPRLHRRAVGLLLFLSILAAPAVRAEETPAPESAEIGEAPIFSAGPFRYRPGRGLRVGSTGLVIGGFTNIKAETTQEEGGEFTLDTLDFFFIFDRFTRFRAVADLQLKDIFTAADGRAGTHEFAFDVRRLFGDFTVSDQLHLRAGTFLTPVGYWNLILAPPLTWTTEPPLIVEETFFQQTTTGVMLHGSTPLVRGRFGYSLFSQFLDPLEDDPDLKPPKNTAGVRLTYESGLTWSAGLTLHAAELRAEQAEPDPDDPDLFDGATSGGWTHLAGAHLHWENERVDVLSEVYFQDGEALTASQWGAYLQGAVEIYRPFYLVGRYEHYNPPADVAINAFTFGLAWRPFPFMAVKLEYRFSDRNPDEDDPQGFFSSFTTLF